MIMGGCLQSFDADSALSVGQGSPFCDEAAPMGDEIWDRSASGLGLALTSA